MNRPAENMARRVQELALLVELSPGPMVGRRTMLTHLTEILLKWDADNADEARGEDFERRIQETECF